MHLQRVERRRLNWWSGLIVVIAIVAATVIDSAVMTWASPIIGSAVATILFYAIGLTVAIVLIRVYVLAYTYVMNDSLLRLSHAYGRYERFIDDIYFNNIAFYGDPEEAKKRFPDGKVSKVYRKECPLPVRAVVTRDEGRAKIYLIRPDEKIEQALMNGAKKK